MLKVLIVSNRLDPALGAGTARKATTLARALNLAGVHTELAAFDMGLDTPQAQVALMGLTVHRVPCVMPRWPVPVIAPRTVREQVQRADVVLLINHWTTINVLYARAARRVGRPYVVMPCGALEIFGRSARLKQVYNRLVGQRLVRNATAWIATTGDEVRSFESYDVPRSRVDVIPNAVDSHEAEQADGDRFRRNHAATGAFVLYVGRLALIKGPDLLLEAWSRLADHVPHHLILAGPEGEVTPTVTGWLARHGARTRARWIGPLDRASTLDAFAAAALLVVPSRLEAMSLVALEAGLTGCPVIATTACGFPSLAEHGGLVAEPEVEPLADALAQALSWSPDERTTRGQRLHAYIERSHSWTAVIPRYVEVLERAAGRRRC